MGVKLLSLPALFCVISKFAWRLNRRVAMATADFPTDCHTAQPRSVVGELALASRRVLAATWSHRFDPAIQQPDQTHIW
jgi:hypothetical protein